MRILDPSKKHFKELKIDRVSIEKSYFPNYFTEHLSKRELGYNIFIKTHSVITFFINQCRQKRVYHKTDESRRFSMMLFWGSISKNIVLIFSPMWWKVRADRGILS